MVALGEYPAQIDVPPTGVVAFNAGATTADPTVHVEIVLQAEFVQPYVPPVLLD
jgi:hypothetical protein